MKSVAWIFLAFTAVITPAAGNASDCGGQVAVDGQMKCVDVTKELTNVRTFFSRGNETLLAATQALITVDPDGRWGPKTSAAFQRNLEAYVVIGGRGSDWGVNNPSDTERFILWLAQAKFANETGAEYPD